MAITDNKFHLEANNEIYGFKMGKVVFLKIFAKFKKLVIDN